MKIKSLIVSISLFFSVLATASATDTNQPMRIVSAGGSVTEILYALGLADYIVATDTSSTYPEQAQQLPKIGYYRQLGTEGVLSLQPSHLLATQGVGPASVVAQIEQTGVDVQVFSQQRSVEGLLTLIKQIGDKTGREAQAQALIDNIQAGIAQLQPQLASHRPVFMMSANERGLMVAGSNTVPNLLMDLLALDNPFSQLDGFKPVSVESLLATQANVLFMPLHQAGGRTPEQICALPALQTWQAVNGCNLHLVDPLLFLGLTPRLPMAARAMSESLTQKSD